MYTRKSVNIFALYIPHAVWKPGFCFHHECHVSVIIPVHHDELADPTNLDDPPNTGKSEDPAGHEDPGDLYVV